MEPALKIPSNLHPYAREVLTKLGHHPAAREIVLGRGVALSHYHEYRDTFDVDGWWRAEKSGDVVLAIKEVMREIAERDRLTFREREWREVISLELLREMKKQFSVQIGGRTVALDQPQKSPWGDIGIETFRDNIASKMTALVERGAPRDFLDIYEVCHSGMLTPEKCWEYYLQKNPAKALGEEQIKILLWLKAIEDRRPAEQIQDPKEREAAIKTRAWFKTMLCNNHELRRQMGLQPVS